MAFKVVMVGMDKWYAQDVVPLSRELQRSFKIYRSDIRDMRDPTASDVLAVLKEVGTTAPGTLLFYYSGHGRMEDGKFRMCTSTPLCDDALTTALKAGGAQKIMVVVDACHSGGFEVKAGAPGEVSRRLETLARGQGMAVLAACNQKDETPGTSPLTKALTKVLSEKKEAVLDVNLLKQRVEVEYSEVELHVSNGFTPFSLSPGMTIVGTCSKHGCARNLTQVEQHCGKGRFRITASFFPCPACHKGLKVESVHFDSCRWQVNHVYIDHILGDCVSVSTGWQIAGPGNTEWRLNRESYMTLDVEVQ